MGSLCVCAKEWANETFYVWGEHPVVSAEQKSAFPSTDVFGVLPKSGLPRETGIRGHVTEEAQVLHGPTEKRPWALRKFCVRGDRQAAENKVGKTVVFPREKFGEIIATLVFTGGEIYGRGGMINFLEKNGGEISHPLLRI